MSVKEKLPMHLSACLLLLVSTFASSLAASQAGIDWDTYWPSDDDKIIDAINEGELNFLEQPPEKPVHHHQNRFFIDRSSIESGWIRLEQCHDNLDKFHRAQIVYNHDRIRQLRITEFRNIGDARVVDHTVQLTEVGNHARLCVEAESRALTAQQDGTFVLENGPFMRKFLDGYFPMRVTIEIQLPENLNFIDIEPGEQPGLSVVRGEQQLHLDAWFEGRLVTRIRFKLSPETNNSKKKNQG